MDRNAAVSDGYCGHTHHSAAGHHILLTHANHIRCEALDEHTKFQATWLEIHMGFGIGSHQFLQFHHIRCILAAIRHRHIISHNGRCHKTFILRNRMDWLRQIVLSQCHLLHNESSFSQRLCQFIPLLLLQNHGEQCVPTPTYRGVSPHIGCASAHYTRLQYVFVHEPTTVGQLSQLLEQTRRAWIMITFRGLGLSPQRSAHTLRSLTVSWHLKYVYVYIKRDFPCISWSHLSRGLWTIELHLLRQGKKIAKKYSHIYIYL